MAYTLTFGSFTEYDAGLPGITLQVRLSLAEKTLELSAKIDTGATDCIFARKYGEQLHLTVEDGERVQFNTATGGFFAFRHDVTIKILDYEFDAVVCFAEDENFNRNVFGRHGFLDRTILGLVDLT